MRRGDFAAAWRLSDQTLQSRRGVPCWHWPRHLQYIWDGTPLDGKRVLVRCYHGRGDTIQFIRYAARLRGIAREVIVWAQPSLLDLLATVDGIDLLLPLHDGVPDVQYDVDVELMELPYVFRTTLDTIPRAVPYIHLPDKGEMPSPREGGDLRSIEQFSTFNSQPSTLPLKVGLVWRSGDWDERRSVPVHLLRPIGRIPQVELFVLQHGSASAEWGNAGGVVVGEHTVTQAAYLVRAMDLVITVDTFAAHLAGALAVPVWTLLPAEADWRWMRDRDDSPWYPTMRLFRQPRAGAWEPVVAQLLDRLAAVQSRDP